MKKVQNKQQEEKNPAIKKEKQRENDMMIKNKRTSKQARPVVEIFLGHPFYFCQVILPFFHCPQRCHRQRGGHVKTNLVR
ncbi:hypothetical protein FK545_16360 [Planococcus glaciei]|nr:hypothetical protein [Planococcus glaciei]QDY46354.1 hypothetical protein FK545_16360 [Planococcus glaciei]